MRWTVVSVLVLGVATAHAGGDTNWDGTYEKASGGGYAYCPDATAPVTVSGGKFSIPWNAKLSKTFRIGTIEGSVRPSGLAVFKATLSDPMPADAKAALESDGDKLEELQRIASEMKLSFSGHGGREIRLSAGMCYASWSSGPAPADAAKPKSTKSASAVKAPPPVAAGSRDWDTTYKVVNHYGEGWWCPEADAFEKIAVTNGRVAIPWQIESRSYGAIAIGEIDGTIAANGSVKLRPWSSVSELPPELAEGRPAKEATLSFVTAVPPKMTFSRSGGVRVAQLSFGKTCEYGFASGDTVAEKKAPPAGSGSSSSKGSSSKTSSTSTGTSPSKSSPPPPPAPKKGKGNGAECTYASECASDHCNYGKCTSGDSSRKALGNGMECTYDSDCASNECTYHKCASKDGKKNLASGAECVYGSDCASGECLYHKCE